MEVHVFGQSEFVIKDLYMNFEIVKDLEEEPNEATIRIYNQDEDNRRRLTNVADQDAPIEIWLTPSASDELVMSYRGEIDTVDSNPTRPGYETTIECLSQKGNHRARFIDKKTFDKGTSISSILDFFVDQIGLPLGTIDEFPDTGVLLSQSFSGPAYRMLQRYAFDVGMYAYILDGKINVTSIYEPPNLTVTKIPREVMLTAPEATSRQDEQFVEMQTIVESSSIDPFRKKRRRRKRKKFTKVKGANDYVQYEAVDKTILGMNFNLLLQPHIQPDYIVNGDKPAIKNRFFRVIEVEHFGNTETFEDWTTNLKTDEYDNQDGNLIGGF
jgi:hypothetical protein